MFVSRSEVIRSKLSIFSAYVSGVIDREAWCMPVGGSGGPLSLPVSLARPSAKWSGL